MSATVVMFPSVASGPVRFTREAQGALIALCASRPRWEVTFAVDDVGDDYACLEDTMFDVGATFIIGARRGGVLVTWADNWTDLGMFATGAEAVAALRQAGV